VASNRRVQYFLERFTGTRREVIERWLDRSTRYLHMVRHVFRQKGIPEDLAYTAMIESGFDPTAVSRVGAKGLWQFMARTARRYGLRVDHWVDERLDPEKSTYAAAAYLRDLHSQFGSWLLAQAAYNAGDGKVTRAIRLTRTNDFWELAQTRHLRAETKDFVPAIQAMTVIARDPDQFGFGLGSAETRRFDTVRVPPLTDLRRLSRTAGVSFESIRNLNLELWRSVTPPRAPWVLKVPEGTQDEVRQALQVRVPVARAVLSPRGVHVVRPRETVSGIARKYGVSITDILRWNRLARRDRIRPGDRIRIARLEPELEAGQGGFR
jgi:membrane-bound lytic murein transglycosylase D